jgi:hypothetical protein
MSEKDKGHSFRSLFFRDSGTVVPPKQEQNAEPAGSKIQREPVSDNFQSSSGVTGDQSLVEDFVKRLQNLINQNNQPGFDFLEFTESLFEEKQNPGPEVYKTVFRIAQKIDNSLTPIRLLDSAKFYKDLVQKTADNEVSKGESKKQSLQTDKESERKDLDTNLKSTRTKIQQLTRQIQDLQTQEVTLNNQLMALDQKYESQFQDIEKKISAIRSAKEEVLVSIVDIEAGIKSNLS